MPVYLKHILEYHNSVNYEYLQNVKFDNADWEVLKVSMLI